MKMLNEIDKYLEEKNLQDEISKVRKSHHPSEGSSCKRAIVYKWLKAPVTNPRDAVGIWRMEMGKAVELLAIKYLREMGYEVDDQKEINLTYDELEYPVHGYIDIAIELPESSYRGEVKTTWGHGTKDISYNGPRDGDIAQARCYMLAEKLETYNMIYIARDTLWRSEYQISWDMEGPEGFEKFIVEKFKLIEYYVKNGIIPPRDFKAIVADGEVKGTIQRNNVKYKSDWQCMYCVRRDHCYADERSDFKLHLPEGL